MSDFTFYNVSIKLLKTVLHNYIIPKFSYNFYYLMIFLYIVAEEPAGCCSFYFIIRALNIGKVFLLLW